MSRIEELIESIRKRNPLKDPTTKGFKHSGEATAVSLGSEIAKLFGDDPEIKILDFGAAAGRVALPLAKRFPRAEISATDVDEEAIEYLSLLGRPNITCHVNGFQPPLDFEDGTFDVIYALSVWSHISEEDGLSWLSEFRRIGRPGALVLISTGGLATLKKFRENSELWHDVEDSDLAKAGIIYREFKGIDNASEKLSGIAGDGSWGDAFIHPDYIHRSWGNHFDAIDVYEGFTGGTQDLVVMRVRKEFMSGDSEELQSAAEVDSATYVPTFPHGHYHSYEVRNRELTALNSNFRQRAEDIALICNMIGARSFADVGSNLGGFLFYMEKAGRRTHVLGIEGDTRFVDECRFVASLLDSRAKLICNDVMQVESTDRVDAIILQNVYHYIYDKVGDHEAIFRKLAELGRSIIWYNPMDSTDPVIPEWAHSNKESDWSKYTHKDIIDGAIKAGFLHPIPLNSRFKGMGKSREHYLFVLDEVQKITPRHLSDETIGGERVDVMPYYETLHEVFLDEMRSFKIFLDERTKPMDGVQRAINLGILDCKVCGTIDFVVNADRKVIGFSQPRGVGQRVAEVVLGDHTVRSRHARMVWTLVSRMLRHNVFFPDIGLHNFVFPAFRLDPIMIDVENLVFDAHINPRLSIYREEPNENEVQGISANLRLVFPDVDVDVRAEPPINALRRCLEQSDFLTRIDVAGILL